MAVLRSCSCWDDSKKDGQLVVLSLGEAQSVTQAGLLKSHRFAYKILSQRFFNSLCRSLSEEALRRSCSLPAA